jgi:phage-related minor tail protein
MSAIPFLRDQEFQPEQIEVMADAYKAVCASLGLVDRADAITQLVARHIIELAQKGVQSSTSLYLDTMREFNPAAAE